MKKKIGIIGNFGYLKMSEKISDTEFDRLNHKAYLDVLDAKEADPLLKNNETYMSCYRAWRNHAGEAHFDQHYEDIDLEM